MGSCVYRWWTAENDEADRGTDDGFVRTEADLEGVEVDRLCVGRDGLRGIDGRCTGVGKD